MKKYQKIGIVAGISVFIVVSIIMFPYFLGLFSPGASEDKEFNEIDYIEITVLIDNHPNDMLNAPWGLSMLVETSNLTILFDSGPDPEALEENVELLGKDLSSVDFGVISHSDFDHVDGLTYVSGLRNNIRLYTPFYGSSLDWMEGFNVIEISETTVIETGIAIIAISDPPYENALAINVKNLGVVILVGCSHPGVENIVAKAKEELAADNIYMVIGGFHLTRSLQEKIINTADTLIDQGVQKIYPLHCSSDAFKDYLQSNYPNNYGEAEVGFQIVLNSS